MDPVGRELPPKSHCEVLLKCRLLKTLNPKLPTGMSTTSTPPSHYIIYNKSGGKKQPLHRNHDMKPSSDDDWVTEMMPQPQHQEMGSVPDEWFINCIKWQMKAGLLLQRPLPFWRSRDFLRYISPPLNRLSGWVAVFIFDSIPFWEGYLPAYEHRRGYRYESLWSP